MNNEKVRNAISLLANGKEKMRGQGFVKRVAKKTHLSECEVSIELIALRKKKKIECDWSNNEPIGNVIIHLPIPDRLKVKTEWQDEIDKHSFPGSTKLLKSRPIFLEGRSHNSIISAFERIPNYLNSELYLREISSQLFWGLSKVLDSRENLIAELLGLESCPFPEKPLSIRVHIPSHDVQGVLFIENEVSFLVACKGRLVSDMPLMFVYASGYKTGTPRIRDSSSASVFYSASSIAHNDVVARFEIWLEGKDEEFSSFFWGDLDFSGMGILASLKKVFPAIEPWEPGYSQMLNSVLKGNGHTPEEAGKDKQEDPGSTGCKYADSILLPALRLHGRFLDQE